jgi:hypothetical protein
MAFEVAALPARDAESEELVRALGVVETAHISLS